MAANDPTVSLNHLAGNFIRPPFRQCCRLPYFRHFASMANDNTGEMADDEIAENLDLVD